MNPEEFDYMSENDLEIYNLILDHFSYEKRQVANCEYMYQKRRNADEPLVSAETAAYLETWFAK